MARIEIHSERELAGGWSYRVVVSRDCGAVSEHDVRLAWVDHEHWCGGRLPPSRIVELLMEFLVAREGDRPIPERFDAATVRRWWPDLDAELQGRN